ncbi:MAG TPA: DUF4399 domain-containing protein [Steroidobacteraceae bacterium]|jgi:hypothetical protein|nr:DUF4399 domain-containing protein [Steroidobacteraceae bacterium]
MKIRHLAHAACVASLALAATVLAREPSPANAEVYIVSPKDGAKVKSPVTVVFGLKGMGIAPAGIKFDNTGHHHLLIDSDLPADLSQPLPATEKSVHFGKGQTETSVTLAPGKHTLQLVLGDSLHIPHDPAVFSKKITIEVE